ncbi:MAG: ABC transporter permease [Burkholderiales bacterium]|nr:ABC transporter permease [Burkholderiales bacterium]MDE2394275.1 ABC transporter permease [Burkholderiales bacterium]
MLRYTLRRLVLLVPVLLGLTMLVFAIGRLLPGDPVRLAAGPNASDAEVAALAREFGLDQPIPLQYWHYLTGLLHGDWGRSLQSRGPVLDDLKVFLPATLELVFAAMAIAIAVGIALGLLAAVWRNGWVDYSVRLLSLASISMPRFFLGLLLQLVFAMWLGWFSLGGRFPLTASPPPTITGMLTLDSLLAGDMGAFVEALKHLALPALAMSLSPLATITRMMRASTIEVLQQDYVLTARALGIPAAKLMFKHVLRNALSATLTVIGLYFGWLLSGTVLVETVFDWPGIGLYATKSILTQDFMPIMGVVLVIGTLFVVFNLIVDLLYGVIDPRVKLK